MANQEPAIHTYPARPRYSIHITLTLICIVVAFPGIYALQVATLTGVESLQSNPPRLFPPGTDFFNNVNELVVLGDFDRLLWNTLVVAIFVVIGRITIAMLAGFAFVYFQFPGRYLIFLLGLLTLLMPTEIIILPLFRIVADLKWAETNPRLAFTVPFLGSAISVFLFRQHFNNIPREMVEVAQLDGASPLRFLVAILLPMSNNILAALTVIHFIGMWHQFVWPHWLFSSDSPDQVIQVGILNMTGLSAQTDLGMLMAANVISSLLPIILFILFQKQLVSGFGLTREQ